MLHNCPSSSTWYTDSRRRLFPRAQFMLPDTFNPHTHTVHVPRHFQSTHAHSSCSPTLSIHTRTQFMFSDTFNPHTRTVHVLRHFQSAHAHSSCFDQHTHTVHVPRHPQSTHAHPIIICIPLTPLCRPLLVDHSTENSACNCTNFAALHSRSSRLPKSFPAPNGVSTG